MDPRHPEQSIARMRELMKQYDRVEHDMNTATTSAKLGQLELEGGLVIQEICLVAPRLHEAMIQTSRQRRHDLSHGTVVGSTDQIVVVNEAITEEAEVVEKPKKKATRKKKSTKKNTKKVEE